MNTSRSTRARSTRSPTATSTSSRRAANVFDRVVVAVLANPRKAPLLAVETRIRVIRDALRRGRRAARPRSRSPPSTA